MKRERKEKEEDNRRRLRCKKADKWEERGTNKEKEQREVE